MPGLALGTPARPESTARIVPARSSSTGCTGRAGDRRRARRRRPSATGRVCRLPGRGAEWTLADELGGRDRRVPSQARRARPWTLQPPTGPTRGPRRAGRRAPAGVAGPTATRTTSPPSGGASLRAEPARRRVAGADPRSARRAPRSSSDGREWQPAAASCSPARRHELLHGVVRSRQSSPRASGRHGPGRSSPARDAHVGRCPARRARRRPGGRGRASAANSLSVAALAMGSRLADSVDVAGAARTSFLAAESTPLVRPRRSAAQHRAARREAKRRASSRPSDPRASPARRRGDPADPLDRRLTAVRTAAIGRACDVSAGRSRPVHPPLASSRTVDVSSSSRSARVMRRMSSSKLVCGSQPRSRSALA